MTILRFNTFFFDFRNVPPPTDLDCHRWLRGLGVKNGDAEVISYSKYRKRITLKLFQSEKFQTLASIFSEKTLYYIKDGEQYPISFFMCNGKKKTIKISEVPAEIDMEKFIHFFSNYGRVLNRKWDDLLPDSDQFLEGAHKDILIIEAELDKDIPSFIFFEGEKLQVNYLGQPQTCSICQSPSHRAGDCPIRRPLNTSPVYDRNFPRIEENITSHSQANQPGTSFWTTPKPSKQSRPQQTPYQPVCPIKNKFQQLSDSTDLSDEDAMELDEPAKNTYQNKPTRNLKNKKNKLSKESDFDFELKTTSTKKKILLVPNKLKHPIQNSEAIIEQFNSPINQISQIAPTPLLDLTHTPITLEPRAPSDMELPESDASDDLGLIAEIIHSQINYPTKSITET